MGWKKRILIMEDNVRLALSWKQVFELYEACEVFLCHNSGDAVRHLTRGNFDIVITDLLVTGDKGGIGVLQQIDRMGALAPPVIVVTGEKMTSVFRRDADDVLAAACLPKGSKTMEKPFLPHELVAAARTLW